MAFSVITKPDSDTLYSTLQPIVAVLSDVGLSGYNYQFAVRIKDMSSNVLAVLYLQPNNNEAAVFDISQIMDAYVSGPSPYHTSGGAATLDLVFFAGTADGVQDELTSQSDTGVTNHNPLMRALVDYGYSVSPNPGDIPNIIWSSQNNDLWCIRFPGVDSDSADYNSVQAFSGATLATLSSNVFNIPLLSDLPLIPTENVYHPGADVSYLSNVMVDYVNSESLRVLTWPIGNGNSDVLQRDADYVYISWWNGSSVINGYVTAISSLGDCVIANGANNVQECLPMLACGPANVRTNTANPGWATQMAGSSWTHYDIILYQSGAPPLVANQRSSIYRFYRTDEPCLYDQYTIFFANTCGGWDAIDINKEHEETIGQDFTQEYIAAGGNYLEAGATTAFRYSGLEGGTRRRRVRTRKSVSVGTGWWPESRNQLMESLLMTTDAYECRNGKAVRIVIQEKSLKLKTRNSDGRFRYTFTYEYARTRTR